MRFVSMVLSSGLFLYGNLCSQILLDNLKTADQASASPVTIHAVRVNRDDTATVQVQFTFEMRSGIHVYAAESLFFKIGYDTVSGLGKPAVGLPQSYVHENFDGTIADVYKNGQQVRISWPVGESRWYVAGFLQYQACDDKMCFLPVKFPFLFSGDPLDSQTIRLEHGGMDETDGHEPVSGDWRRLAGEFDIAGTAAGYLDRDALCAFLENPAGAGANPLAGKSLAVIVLLVLLGGLALNLTPCVLPMIPITVAVLGAGTREGNKKRGFVLGTVYGTGMSLAYGMLGLIVILTGSRFGVLNSSGTFNLGVAAVFLVLALAMFDIIHIDFTKYRKGGPRDAQSRGKIAVAFVTGVIAALLAGACVAPVVISVILYSAALYTQGNNAGLLLPFLLGAGMAVPWPFAGAGLSFLPKPGQWMVWVRNGFGVIILVMALYYGWTGVKLFHVPGEPDKAVSSNLPWNHSLEQGLIQARQEQKPVFIDFWASWCKNCLVMDATTFKNPDVEKKLSSFVLIKYRAENTLADDTKPVLDYFKVLGLPTCVILSPR